MIHPFQTAALGAALTALMGCGGEAGTAGAATSTPAEGPSFGHYSVVLDLANKGVDPGAVVRVTVGEINAYDLTALDDHRLQVMVQGHPTPGPVEVVLHAPSGAVSIPDAFSYAPPLDPRFARIAALGASITQGVQRGVPTYHGALMGPAAQIARHLGGFMPLPLLVPGLFPSLVPGDLGPAPACRVPDVVAFVTEQSGAVIPKLTDPETEEFGFHFGRLDPDVAVHNVAVGGATIGAALHGTDDFGNNFVAHLVYEPFAGLLGRPSQTQVERIEELAPTLILSTDLYGNDLLYPLLGSDLSPMPPAEVADIAANIVEVVGRLAQTGAEVFLGNLPYPGQLPAAKERRLDVASGALAPETLKTFIDSLEDATTELNATLAQAASGHSNVHVVDLNARVEEIAAEGLRAGEHDLSISKLGGLVGIDGVHFTDTGYAFLANTFIERINEALGTDAPLVDVGEVAARDPETPHALLEAGLDAGACQ